MIESYGSIQINVPFSIKRTLFQIFKKSLLNVPFNLENEGLNIYKKGTYNREQRVRTAAASAFIESSLRKKTTHVIGKTNKNKKGPLKALRHG